MSSGRSRCGLLVSLASSLAPTEAEGHREDLGHEMTRSLAVTISAYDDAAEFHKLTRKRRTALAREMASHFPTGFIKFRFLGLLEGSSEYISRADLLEAFVKTGGGSGNPEQWHAHLVFARSFEVDRDDTFGLMWDHDIDPSVSRRGCAVFLDAISEKHDTAEARRLMVARTMAHELGHTLNLCHTDADNTPRSIMVPGEVPVAALRKSRFSAQAGVHVERAPVPVVRPGTAVRYGDRSGCTHPSEHPPCRDCDAGSRSSSGGARTATLTASVYSGVGRKFRGMPVLVVGEPVLAQLELRNLGKRSFSAHHAPTSSNTELAFFMKRPGSNSFEMLTPPLLGCGTTPAERTIVGPGKTVRISEILAHRRGQAVLRAPGEHTLIARMKTTRGWLEATPVSLYVESPQKARHNVSAQLATDPRLSLFLETRGFRADRRTITRARQLVAANRRFPANALALVCLSGDSSRHITDRKAALRRLRRLPAVADPIRWEGELAHAESLARSGDKPSAKRLLKRLEKITDDIGLQNRVARALLTL